MAALRTASGMTFFSSLERIGAMRTDLFDFELPAASIALRPASPRDAARMLVVQGDGVLRDRLVGDLPDWLEPGDQLVVNDTKVISAPVSYTHLC